MKLEEQVCNLELAKRLKELDVKQESYFHWYEASGGWNFMAHSWSDVNLTKKGFKQVKNEYSAFTVAELGEMLPRNLSKPKVSKTEDLYEDAIVEQEVVGYLSFSPCRPGFEWWAGYEKANGEGLKGFTADTEADARAKLFIYLLEKKLIPTPSSISTNS